MSKILDNAGWDRIQVVLVKRATAEMEVHEAREAWWQSRSDEARERWRVGLVAEQAAEAEYWAVTGEYFEKLGPRGDA